MYYPNPENFSSFPGLMQYDNTVTGGIYGYGILLMVWVISFAALSHYVKKYALASSCFVTLTVAYLLWLLHLVNFVAIVICAFGVVVSSLLMFLTR